ncbi:MAG TPA: beta-xylosidase [Verrucomicrobiae bacterium]|nr:beta-xylosidase [Verrucomicrobiae bacterium]
MPRAIIFNFILLASFAFAQEPVTIRIDASAVEGPFNHFFRFFGYDEPNYTYAPNGRKLIRELAGISPQPAYIRTHFLLASGDGKPSFKWGSTNVYTEDASGKPVYDWTLVDRIFDTYTEAGARPYVEIGFTPQALSPHPDPYVPVWSPGAPFDKYYVGWAYPPKDYDKWSRLIETWVRHCIERYGKGAVESWYWEVWNEPDIAYFHGTPEEYDKLYDVTAAAVKRVLPTAKVGGPATTGPSANGRSGAYLRQFLQHCQDAGTPLDFISYHAKGSPRVVDGHVRMGISNNASAVAVGLDIISAFPKFSKLPVVLSESDPEGCAACSARVYPQNAYRNTPLYASYTAAMMKNIVQLEAQRKANIEGMLTWAFEFEGQPYFEGFRTLATNGVDKPVLNVFRMAGLMNGDRIVAESSGARSVEQILREGVRQSPDIDALAVRGDRRVLAMVWNYHDDDVPSAASPVRVTISGMPEGPGRVLLRHYRIDETHSNAFTAWKAMGSPQSPAPEQYAKLVSAGELQQMDSPRWVEVRDGKLEISLDLPRQAVSLLEVGW